MTDYVLRFIEMYRNSTTLWRTKKKKNESDYLNRNEKRGCLERNECFHSPFSTGGNDDLNGNVFEKKVNRKSLLVATRLHSREDTWTCFMHRTFESAVCDLRFAFNNKIIINVSNRYTVRELNVRNISFVQF